MLQATLSARYKTTSTDVSSTSISKVQYNQYGCHKHLYQQGTTLPVRCHRHLYQQGKTQPLRMSQATLSARYNTTSTDVTSTSISKVQYSQNGCHKNFHQQGTTQIVRCHKHLYQQGTTQPVRMSQTTLSARYSTTSTDVTSTSISKVQYNKYGCHNHLYQQGTVQPVRFHKHLYQQGTTQQVRMSQAPLSARYSTTSTDVTSTSISKVQ